MGELSCVKTRLLARERGKGHEWVAPPRRISGGGRKMVDQVKEE